MRCDVSTLPAAIAAGSSADTTDPAFAMTRIGRSRPAVNGTSLPQQATEHVSGRRDQDGAIGIHRTGCLRIAAGEVHLRFVTCDPDLYSDSHRLPPINAIVIQPILKANSFRREARASRAHHFLAVGLQLPHVARHDSWAVAVR